jgi:hypothetical protein
LEFLHDLQHNCESRLSVNGAAPVNPAALDAAIKRVIRHMFYAHCVEVDVDCDGSIRCPFEAGVDVAPTIKDFVNDYVGA